MVALLAAAGAVADTEVVEVDTAAVEAADMTAVAVVEESPGVIVIVIVEIAVTEAIAEIAVIAAMIEEESATAASDFVTNLIFERPPLCGAFPQGMRQTRSLPIFF